MKSEEMATAGAGFDDERRRSDLSLATDAALNIELAYGMGLMRFSERSASAMMHDPKVASPVRERLDRCFRRAKALVAANADAVRHLAAELEAAGFLDKAADLSARSAEAPDASPRPPDVEQPKG